VSVDQRYCKPVVAVAARTALAGLGASVGAHFVGVLFGRYVDSGRCEELKCLGVLPLLLLCTALLTWIVLRVARVPWSALVVVLAAVLTVLLAPYCPLIWGPWPANLVTIELAVVPSAAAVAALRIRLGVEEF
jgi:hypothetical protein